MVNPLEEYVARSVLCWLATVDETGAPNLSPKEVFGLFDGRIVIANIASPRSSRNLKSNPHACVSLLDIFEQKGVRVTGLGAVCLADDVEMAGARALLNTLTDGRFPFSEIFVIEVGDVQSYSAPSWHLYPEVDPAERRAGVLRSYGVQDVGD